MLSLAVLFLLTAIVYYIWAFYENVKRFPKGPTPIPILGNLLNLNTRKFHEQLSTFSEKYGSVFTVWLPRPYVIITDYELIKEAFAKSGDDFSGRPNCYPSSIFQVVANGGVIHSEGDNWKEQRRVSLHILRDFGMGKNLMEEQVLLSAQEFLSHMKSIKNKDAVDLQHPIQVFIANIINKTLFGFSYEYDKSDRLMTVVSKLTKLFDDIQGYKLVFLAQMFPILQHLPVVGFYARGQFERILDDIKTNIRDDVKRSLESYTVEQEPECFVQAYYQRMQTNPNLDYDNLLSVCLDFFIAGMETTTTTLRWSALFLAKNIDIQDKIRAEIFSVLGPDGKPNMSLKSSMPYTCAAIQEIQRRANIVPVNVIHRTTKDTKIGSFPIPVDTFVVGQIQHVMAHSPVYEQSLEFRPERFLMEDGVTPNKETVEQLCPFSVGKRQCAGEALARVELFLGLITLLQNYKIEPAKGEEIDLEPIFAAVLLPKPHRLRLIPV